MIVMINHEKNSIGFSAEIFREALRSSGEM